jgi:hypothetical protein
VRKLISFSLLFLFLWQIGGYVIEFQLESGRIRKQIKKLTKEAVPRNQLINFQFTQKEINSLIWVKSHEFRKEGHFYDVVWKKDLGNGKFEFQCVSDDQETLLFKKMDEYVSANLVNSDPDKPLKNWSKLFFGNYLPNDSFPKLVLQKSLIEINSAHFEYLSTLSEQYKFVETPPPNMVFS